MARVFERFTEPARQVVTFAQEEAHALKHNYIGTEHILLGLVREQKGVAAQALKSLGLELEEVRTQVVAIIGPGEEVPSGQIPFTPRAKKVLELALREALSLGHNYLGPEHILLGLARENEGVASRILDDAGADAEKVRSEVIGLVGSPEYRPPEAAAGRSSRVAPAPSSRSARLAGMLASRGDPPAQLAAVRRCDDAAGRALELALAETLRRGDQEITPESLLVGLAGAEHTLAQRILRERGLDADQLRADIDRDSPP